MARLIGLAALSSALWVSGCGGHAASPACDDDAFRAQDEELYAAQATAQNAALGGATRAALVADLRAGAGVLDGHLASTEPCDAELRALEARERAAVLALRAAADRLEGGTAPPGAELARIANELGAIQGALQPSAG